MSPRALWLALAALVMLAFPREAEAQSCSVDAISMSVWLVQGTTQSYNVPLRITCQGEPSRSVLVCISGWGNALEDARGNSIPIDYNLFDNKLPVVFSLAASGSGVGSATVTLRIGPVTSRHPSGIYAINDRTVQVRATYSSIANCNQSTSTWPSQNFIFDIRGTFDPVCTVTSASLDFGTRILTTAADAQTNLSVTCTAGKSYTIRLGNGRNGGTGPTNRRMASGTNTLIYGLYRDAARVQPWGDTAATGISDVGTGLPKSHAVYGRIPAQPAPPGNYSDVVQVTVVY